jgi:2-keto-4-pentenoate hydratase
MFADARPSLPLTGYRQPRVNSGVAFVLRSPLSGVETTVADAVRAVDFVLPAMEITDSRIDGRGESHLDAAADNAYVGGVVLGTTARPVIAIDLRLAGALVVRNGEVAQTGAGGSVLHAPLQALVWLARAGVSLAAGQLVLASSFTPPVEVAAGDRFTVTIAGIGSVSGGFAR